MTRLTKDMNANGKTIVMALISLNFPNHMLSNCNLSSNFIHIDVWITQN